MRCAVVGSSRRIGLLCGVDHEAWSLRCLLVLAGAWLVSPRLPRSGKRTGANTKAAQKGRNKGAPAQRAGRAEAPPAAVAGTPTRRCPWPSDRASRPTSSGPGTITAWPTASSASAHRGRASVPEESSRRKKTGMLNRHERTALATAAKGSRSRSAGASSTTRRPARARIAGKDRGADQRRQDRQALVSATREVLVMRRFG